MTSEELVTKKTHRALKRQHKLYGFFYQIYLKISQNDIIQNLIWILLLQLFTLEGDRLFCLWEGMNLGQLLVIQSLPLLLPTFPLQPSLLP